MRARFGLWLLSFILLTSCNGAMAKDEHVLFVAFYWQTEQEMAALQQAVDAFSRINPDVTIFLESSERFGRDFESQARAGLGADMLVGLPYEYVIDYAQAGYLQELSQFEINTGKYRSQYLNAVRWQDKLYALPFMGQTSVLYYNKDIIHTAPEDLTELLERADGDFQVGLTTNFTDAFWGTQAFGQSLFGEEDQLQMDLQSYVDWFEWLIEAQDQPGLVFDNDSQFLEDKFINGELAYLIDSSGSLLRFQTALGEGKLGVAPLPAGDNGPASPLASLEVIAFNQAAGANKAAVGLRLAEFLTNTSQQQKLVLEGTGHIPVNRSVSITPQLSEIGNAIVRQGATSICIPLDYLAAFNHLTPYGNEAYLQVLEGDIDPIEATTGFFSQAGLSF